MPDYLKVAIVAKKQTARPEYGMTVSGYTARSGAPTSWMIRLEGERIWRRVMVWQFSNAGTLFVTIKGKHLIVQGSDLETVKTEG